MLGGVPDCGVAGSAHRCRRVTRHCRGPWSVNLLIARRAIEGVKSVSLNVNPDGLRRAAGHSDDLASELATPGATTSSSGGSQPTSAAVQAVHALVAGVRADHAAYLSGRAGTLTAGANGYENTDGGSAKSFGETM